ncbi:hypothetical protein D6D10_08307 [Aureobasidium pullulans]|uniref:Uncharacterized protein n=1 Tax=Aureobasidium pullulans TaxID=5580 RepID=A0A4V4J6D4_AURPU|nr:hypothetical protein D6D10_08307 [Aureobasidium pullulans]
MVISTQYPTVSLVIGNGLSSNSSHLVPQFYRVRNLRPYTFHIASASSIFNSACEEYGVRVNGCQAIATLPALFARHCASIFDCFFLPSLRRWIRVAVRRDAASDYGIGCVPADVLIDRRLPADCTPRLLPRGRFTNLTRHVLHRVMGLFGASLFAILHHHRYLNHHPRGSSIPIALFDPSYLGISRLLT